MNKWIIGVIVLIVILGGGYFAAKAVKQSATPTPTPTQTVIAPTATPMPTASATASMKEIVVSGNEFAFTPSVLTVKKGEEVKVTFKNTGKYPHNFTVTDLSVKSETIQPGAETSVTFTPSKTGTFTYFCSVDSHAERGMKGTLTVE